MLLCDPLINLSVEESERHTDLRVGPATPFISSIQGCEVATSIFSSGARSKKYNSQYPLGPQTGPLPMTHPSRVWPLQGPLQSLILPAGSPSEGLQTLTPDSPQALARPSRCVPQGLLGVVVLPNPGQEKRKEAWDSLYPLGSSSRCRFPSRAAGAAVQGSEGTVQHRGLLRPRATGVGEQRGSPLGPYSQHILQGAGADEDGDRVQVGRLQPPHGIGRDIEDAVLPLGAGRVGGGGPAGGGKGQTQAPGQDTVHGKVGNGGLAERGVTWMSKDTWT